MLSIIITLLLNLLIETSVSFTVVVPGDPVVAHVGSTVILPCWISPPENAEALEIRWYRQDQFSNPVVFYRDGKIQDIQEESYRNRSSLTPWSDQSGGLKDGDVSLRLEKLSLQDEGPFHCYVSGDTAYDSREMALKIIDAPGPWKALFLSVLIVLICLILGLVGFILYKYRHKMTGKKPAKENCEDETMEKLTKQDCEEGTMEKLSEEACEDGSLEKLSKEVVGDVNIEELRKHANQITIDEHYVSRDLNISKDRKMVKGSKNYKYTGEGFPYNLYAFGAQKFSSGRHYWEVGLAKPPKNYWLIGVVKDGKFTAKDKSFTPSAGFWFLCSDGPNGFFTNTEPPVKLSLTPRPERLGVLLDYDDGQLSFYNVKESKHLLTISTRFSGSVVPLFNPGVGDQSALKILDCPKPVESAVESCDNPKSEESAVESSDNPKSEESDVESSQPLPSNSVSTPNESDATQHVKSKQKPL